MRPPSYDTLHKLAPNTTPVTETLAQNGEPSLGDVAHISPKYSEMPAWIYSSGLVLLDPYFMRLCDSPYEAGCVADEETQNYDHTYLYGPVQEMQQHSLSTFTLTLRNSRLL